MSEVIHEIGNCPHCGARGEPFRSVSHRQSFVECSNQIECPVWPMTSGHATLAEAIAAWNEGIVTPFEKPVL